MGEFVKILITAGGAAAVSGVFMLLKDIFQRRSDKKNKKNVDVESTLKELQSSVAALKLSEQLIMLDRIKYLGQKHIQDGCVDFDDRRLLNQMHSVYHNQLGGNGDLDVIMRDVNALPLSH